MLQLRSNHIILWVFVFTNILELGSCKKIEDLGELEPNKYSNEISNPVLINEVIMIPQNPTECRITVNFNYNKGQFENDWDNVDSTVVVIQHIGPTNKPSSSVNVQVDEFGNGTATPKYAYTLSTYKISIWLTLENQRKTLVLDSNISTPSY